MDRGILNRLQHAATNPNRANHTEKASLGQLPSTVLEAFIPGYSLISNFILDAFGFDVAILVSCGLIAFATLHISSYLWNRGYSLFKQFLTSSVYIDDGDDLFDSILDWIGEQQMAKVARSVKAVTKHSHNLRDGSSDSDGTAAIDEQGIFNFGKWAARTPPRYEPYFGSHRFWHKGRIFYFDRSRREVQVNPWSGRSGDEQLIQLTCVGRSTEPVRELLKEIKLWALKKEKSLTNIRRPASKEFSRRYGAWDRVSSRPSRPMDTISLDHEQKQRIIADINEYLHPSSPQWYSTRGIPWRRGYLFHGPPGTGKSSFCFALAGLFGLDIYVISILEPTLTESDLIRLFNNLPRRCIVLLEDIDTAGLIRDHKSDRDDDDDEKNITKTEGDKISATDIAKAIKSAHQREKQGEELNKGISLSGLLNAIDGVASHEGRVLICSSNHPEKLDAALIRPGRVDMQVAFSLATRQQIRDIFIRMYTDDRAEQALVKQNGSLNQKPLVTNGTANGSAKHTCFSNGTAAGSCPSGVDRDDLLRLAEEFTSQLEEHKFSPAEIQGFLLMRKKDPRRAVREVGAWSESLLEAKEKKAKVVDVQ